MPEKRKPYYFGRVFFPGETKPIPDEVRFQPLGDHVRNVMELVKRWDMTGFPYPQDSLERVLEAAKIHDMAKPEKFSIQSKPKPDGQFKEYSYSFKGHRFSAKSKHKRWGEWAQALAVGHHSFSVEDVAEDIYKLKKNPEYADFFIQDSLIYARELYILEMCDQIEAELACRVMGDEDQADARTFMEFTIAPQGDGQYRIDPWPFQSREPIAMTFRYWSCSPREFDPEGLLQQCAEERNGKKVADLGKTLDDIVKNRWWQQYTGTYNDAEPIAVTLAPYPDEERPQDFTALSFYQAIKGPDCTPNPMQEAMFQAIYAPENQQDSPAILLKSPTGTGKTEAVLFPAIAAGYRVILPLPARSLIDDQRGRIEGYLKQLSRLQPGREFSLVVDTGSQMYRLIYQNGEEVGQGRSAYNKRRHLYKGDVILTTLDKFLYRYFAFGDRNKSFVFPLRIHEAVSHQKKTLICFDEAHSYEQVAFTNFQGLVRALYEAGRAVVLMTATMPPQVEEYFDYLEKLDFAREAVQSHPRGLSWRQDIPIYVEREDGQRDSAGFQAQVAQLVLEQWAARPGGRILVVVETVRDAVKVYEQVKKDLGNNGDKTGQFLFLYHGRIAQELRPALYQRIKARDDQGLPYIVITTSAIEVGCDLNAEVLITQICPPENLIQRVGRCNRRGNVADAQVIIVGNEIPDFANTLDGESWQRYQETLAGLERFDLTAIAACIHHSPHIDDYRVVEVFSMLHSYVYEGDQTCEPTHREGLIPTRSWEPSVELRFLLSDKAHHSVAVPISRLASKRGQQYAFTCLVETHYNQETYQREERRPSWGAAYQKNLLVKIANCKDLVPDAYEYDPELGFVELPKVFSAQWTDGAKVRIKYEEEGKNGKYVAILHYTKPLDQ